MKMKKYIIALTAACAALSCATAQSVTSIDWGKTDSGQNVKLFTLKNKNGITVKVSDYGAIITAIETPDRHGKFADITLGFDKFEDYKKSDYFGAVVGRYGNRIAGGEFSLDGNDYKLPQNNGDNCLHGGIVGFDKKVWSAQSSTTPDAAVLKLSLLSPDGDQGFPGNLKVAVTYTLNNQNELIVNYKATTDKPTVCNLTQHSYFNLLGAGNGNILNHELTINADKFTPVDSELIPTGDLEEVEGTPFDFRKPKTIGSRIEFDDKQLKRGSGYDHNFVINQKKPGEMTFAARAYEPVSGREMIVSTTEPGVQFYCGNFLKGVRGKKGKAYNYRYGFCLETQHFPDSPNQDEFPSTVLRPGETYDTTTVFKFQTQ